MGHFSEQSKCFSSFTGWKLSDSTLKIHQGLVKVLGSVLLHICLCQRMALFVSFRGRGQQNFQHSWLSQDSPTQRRHVCSGINCEGRSAHMSADRKCLESLHSNWELSKRPPWQACTLTGNCPKDPHGKLALSLGTVQKTPMASLKPPTMKTILMNCTWLT